jgi:pimeloyl-ACP methyl ester carboxylesterase
MWRRLLAGGIAGIACSMVMKAMQEAGMRLLPRQMPPLREDPGEFMIDKAEDAVVQAADRLTEAGEELAEAVELVPESVEKVAAQALGVGYGMTFALLFAATRPKVRHVILEGSALGFITWAAGYLGWLPAMRLMKPVDRQKPVQVFNAVGSHLAFGVATVALYRELQKKM